MSKILKIGGIALAAVAVLVGGLLLFVDVDQFRPMIQTQLESSLRREVTLGKMGLKLIPLAIRAEQVAIADDPAFGGSGFRPARRGRFSALRQAVQGQSLRQGHPPGAARPGHASRLLPG